jgi:predicted GNAT family acetyltransferase
MAWTFTDDVATYGAAAGDLLSSAPERHSVLLSVLATLRRRGPTAFGQAAPLLGWWSDGSAVTAAVLQTPPYPLLTTGLDGRSAAELAAALADRVTVLPGINGAEQDAAAFALAWQDVTGQQGQADQRQRLYRLGTLIPPNPAPDGVARLATSDDAAIARLWYAAFAAEAGQEDAPPGMIEDRLAVGQLLLWMAPGGPASMAGMTDVIDRTARIGPVYTPPSLRGQGYGGAVTAAITELAFDRGAASVVLFTDLANPTSNSLYLKLGYEPVEDRILITFGRLTPRVRLLLTRFVTI